MKPSDVEESLMKCGSKAVLHSVSST